MTAPSGEIALDEGLPWRRTKPPVWKFRPAFCTGGPRNELLLVDLRQPFNFGFRCHVGVIVVLGHGRGNGILAFGGDQEDRAPGDRQAWTETGSAEYRGKDLRHGQPSRSC